MATRNAGNQNQKKSTSQSAKASAAKSSAAKSNAVKSGVKKSNTSKASSANSSTAKSSTAKIRQAKPSQAELESTSSFRSEIITWVFVALALLLELGNFGLCGFINYVSQFFFGLFGVIQYVLPLFALVAAFFLHINSYEGRAVRKVIYVMSLLLCCSVMAQLANGTHDLGVKSLFFDGFDQKVGGGILGGLICAGLIKVLGIIGTYIVIIVVILIFVVLLFEFSVMDFIGENSKQVYEDMKETRKEMADKRTQFIEDNENIDDEALDEIFTERKKAREKQKNRAQKKQASNEIERRRIQGKKNSMLESIHILPADYDKGIIRIDGIGGRPLTEDVHEIKMGYEDGERKANSLDENVSEESGFQRGKTIPKAAEERKTKKESEKTKRQTVKQSEKLEVISEGEIPNTKSPSAMKMENKTDKPSKEVSASKVRENINRYEFPPLSLLSKGSGNKGGITESTVRETALKLQEVLKSFGVNVTMTNYSCGPSVTRYEMQPEAGVKVSKITGLADDIMMNLAAEGIRIEAPIPGKAAVGIEIPNKKSQPVKFRDLIDTDKFIKHPSNISFAVGKDITGKVVVEDIAKMPHMLVAGATGSGKSVFINTLIMSILYKAHPEDVKMILIDPKQVELKVYNGIPHLLIPVVTEAKKAAGALNWAVMEMTNRYQLFSECNVRNIQGYNEKVERMLASGEDMDGLKKMPQMVIVVDELADLMMVAKGEVEEAIVRLAQLARAAGIHLVVATQRPSVDVVTGLIKANVPSRVALSVSSGIDSRTIIDTVGAEKLLGNGDMLFYPTMYPKAVRVQGAYISEEEVMRIVSFLKKQNGESIYDEKIASEITAVGNAGMKDSASDSDVDEYFAEAGRYIIEKDKASSAMLQRVFKIGFNRAARIMDQLYEAGVVGAEEGTKPRKVLMSMESFESYINNK